MDIKLYEVSDRYINYLDSPNSKVTFSKIHERKFKRKYIGIVLTLNNYNYFAPLSSFKEKHKTMKETVDFIKIGDYSVININNMIPVPKSELTYVDINNEQDIQYKNLLLKEYRIIKLKSKKIKTNAMIVYKHKLKNGNETSLSRRCCNFPFLENLLESFLLSYTS